MDVDNNSDTSSVVPPAFYNSGSETPLSVDDDTNSDVMSQNDGIQYNNAATIKQPLTEDDIINFFNIFSSDIIIPSPNMLCPFDVSSVLANCNDNIYTNTDQPIDCLIETKKYEKYVNALYEVIYNKFNLFCEIKKIDSESKNDNLDKFIREYFIPKLDGEKPNIQEFMTPIIIDNKYSWDKFLDNYLLLFQVNTDETLPSDFSEQENQLINEEKYNEFIDKPVYTGPYIPEEINRLNTIDLINSYMHSMDEQYNELYFYSLFINITTDINLYNDFDKLKNTNVEF
jgi:hypothetical protein